MFGSQRRKRRFEIPCITRSMSKARRLAGQALEMDDVQIDAVARRQRAPARGHVA